MNRIFTRFFRFCPKTGNFVGIKKLKGLSRFLFPFIGFLALAWILIRVIPKPSRLEYPCMKAAVPFAAGFIETLIVFTVSALAFFKVRKTLFSYQFIIAALFVTFAIGGSYFSDNAFSISASTHTPNEPMGEAKGIFPGRVVWVHDPEATNEDCNPNTYGDGWFLTKNNNQTVIDQMLENGIKLLTGTESVKSAWDSVFINYNRQKGKGDVSYSDNEIIFIKTNATSGWGGNFNPNDLSKINNSSYGISETSPQVVLSVLRHLVNIVGVPEENIYIGDPMKHIYKHIYDLWHAEFPGIHYLDNDHSNLGREIAVKDDSASIFYSDRGTVLRENVMNPTDPGGAAVYNDRLYSIFKDAEYMINIPMLKGHRRAGITAFAKNHFGSHVRSSAAHVHNGLVAPRGTGTGGFLDTTRTGYGLYRVLVDLMGHETLGGKNLIYIMDALWPADQEISYPKKFYMQPFNNDYMSSIFVSLDPVAIESVGFDFLRTEFVPERPDDDEAGTWIQMFGTDDYLHQCADSANWPDNIQYDPENDGTVLASLGVHEHWNNSADMQYSRNLDPEAEGIELVKYISTSVENNNYLVTDFTLNQNYPNPFNPVTNIRFVLNKTELVVLKVYDIRGREVATLLQEEKPAGEYDIRFNAGELASGTYFYKITAGRYSETKKMLLLK